MNKDTFYRNNKMSAPLEYLIEECNDFDEFEKKYSDEFLNEDCRIGNYLDELLRKYNQKDSVASVNARLHESYVGNIVNGRSNNPSRNVLIRICIAIGANVEETQYLLKYAGHAPLYVRKKRDVIIWFGIIKGENLDTVNDNLINRNLEPLYDEK